MHCLHAAIHFSHALIQSRHASKHSWLPSARVHRSTHSSLSCRHFSHAVMQFWITVRHFSSVHWLRYSLQRAIHCLQASMTFLLFSIVFLHAREQASLSSALQVSIQVRQASIHSLHSSIHFLHTSICFISSPFLKIPKNLTIF